MRASVLALVGLVALPTIVAAQNFEMVGAELSYTYRESNTDYTNETRRLSLETLVMGRITAQLDLYNNGYNGGMAYGGYTAHLGYALSNGIVAGAFYSEEDWGADYASRGAEASYASGAFAGAVAIGRYERVDIPALTTFDFARFDGSYRVNENMSLVADFITMQPSTPGQNFQTLGVGARFNLTDNMYTELKSSHMTGAFEHNIFGVVIGYNIGSGTTFGGRDWNGLLTTY